MSHSQQEIDDMNAASSRADAILIKLRREIVYSNSRRPRWLPRSLNVHDLRIGQPNGPDKIVIRPYPRKSKIRFFTLHRKK